jgi:hypothetical protein
VAEALAALASTRKAAGFNYMVGPGDLGGEAECAMRSPLCALALERAGNGAGKGSVDEVRAALELYLKHRDRVRRERGKRLCHTGPEGTASYYLLFGYGFAAEAVNDLPTSERPRFRAALREDVLALRTEDGGFLDNPASGRCYGAGMALWTLARLRDP